METKKTELKKLQFAFTQETLNYMDGLAKRTGVVSKTDLMRNALKVYNWVVEMQEEGYRVRAVKENGSPTVELMDQTFPPRKQVM